VGHTMRRDADTSPDNSLGIAINYQRRTAGKKVMPRLCVSPTSSGFLREA
jgi:hypothetical protein